MPSREPATQPWPQPAGLESPHPPTYVPPHPATDVPSHPPTNDLPQQPATVPPRQQVTDVTPRQPEADAPHQPATIMMPREPQAEAVPHEPMTYLPPRQPPPGAGPPPPDAGPPATPPSEMLRYGPGVPASQAGAAAESVWRTGHRPEPPPRQRRLRRLRRLLGLALTVILLVAAGIVLYLRFFDHPALHVTRVTITQQVKNGCTVDVTGRIDTNGSAGTVSYQWVFRPQTQAPQPLNQSVVAGQHAVYVTAAAEGQGRGTASQTVTLQVLGPEARAASAAVVVSCR